MTNTDPKAFAKRYHQITWTHDKHQFSASVRKYLSENASVCDAERIKGAQTAKGWLLEDLKDEEKATREGKRYRVGGSSFISDETIEDSFAGRATPDELKQTLWLATCFGYIVRPEESGKPKKSTAQQFADWYLGMDCTGFVSAFFGFSGGRSIKSYDVGSSRRRQAFREIQPGDVMIRKEGKEYKHIALVISASPSSGDRLLLDTAESVGWKGKGVSWEVQRELKLKSPGVFVLASGAEGDFYIYPGR
jgi:hypothetical protein